MSRKYLLLLVIILFSTSILITACGTTTAPKAVQLDNGAMDQSYQGVAQPTVPKKLKLSEAELKNGIKKFPIRSSSGQQLIPEAEVKDMPIQDKEQASDVAKPQV
ncbi:hypothetical protein [Sporomusa malonica]|uniref:Uncharacterized protein n=1 Tax=Sporomusa malonica TaxID=112901 RepID=A0A1W1Z987_9FIRM|nr:hypothetical protein [Sporomusa malonica]SMC44964.1 hypothetical protein SAMN04488500_10394 [Sporomusa malonica]